MHPVPLFSGNRRHPNQFSEARRMAKSGGKSTTTKWFNVTVLEEESTLPAGRLLLEEKKRRKDYTGGSHETEGELHTQSKKKDIEYLKCLRPVVAIYSKIN